MPRIIIITGNGKGKTTSAFGMVLRALGHGLKVSIIQFIKSRTDTGEILALKRFPEIEIIQCGLGFIPPAESIKFKHHCDCAQNALMLAEKTLLDKSINMVVLDEICSTVHFKLLSEQDLVSTISKAHEQCIVICTGRYAPKSLIDIADTVSEISSVKHGFEHGIKAQKGVEL